jgi:hypothetical protein
MSSLEEWNRAKQSGAYVHSETQKNWPLDAPTESVTETPIPPDPRPPKITKEQVSSNQGFSWYKLLLMLLVVYCAAVLTFLAFYNEQTPIITEKVVTKVVKIPVKTPPLPAEILTVNYDAYCPSFGDVPTCERLLKRLKLTQQKNKALIRQGQRPSSTITL